MKHVIGRVLFAVAVTAIQASALLAADSPANEASEIQTLRDEIEQMRSDYENRIAELERRLANIEPTSAELSPAQATPATPAVDDSAYAAAAEQGAYEVPSPAAGSGARDNSFNPAIGVTLQGQAWSFGNDPEGYYIPGFPLGGEGGLALEGLSLAETEFSMSANVDDKFTAKVTFPIVIEDGETAVELEEAWVETLALPAGLAVRMGRFFADIGYLNSKHAHAWDFADQALVYQAFLGSQYIDDGLEARWVAPTDFYLELGGEILRGDRYPAAGGGHSGFGSNTLNIKTGGDVGISNSWQFGLSRLKAESEDRASGDEFEPVLFTGDTEIYIADLVWKWAQNGDSRQRNFVFQAEYLWRNEDGFYTFAPDAALPWDDDAQGWYAQAVFQPIPRWRLGVRYDALSGGTSNPDFSGTPLYSPGSDPKRYSMMVDWSNSEFSRVRFQYEHDMSSDLKDDLFALQYIFSIGAHGAHSF